MEITHEKVRIEELRDLNRALRRDLNINSGAEEEYAKRSGAQAKRIGDYKSKINSLEGSLQ